MRAGGAGKRWLENTLQHFTCDASRVQAWLGPAISQAAFEVVRKCAIYGALRSQRGLFQTR